MPSLPACPTRRSSDLVPCVVDAGPGNDAKPVDGLELDLPVPGGAEAESLRLRLHRGAVRVGARSGDRKSTRLNSSHSQISYAVFSLKKKNGPTDMAVA